MRRPLLVVAGAVGALLAVLAARIYASGYGADNDTWLMLGTWDVLVDEHRYVPSRPPGYLLPRSSIGAAADVGGHWLVERCVARPRRARARRAPPARAAPHRRGRDRPRCSSRCSAVTPAFVLAATTSMDYVVGLAAFLAGWALLERRPARPRAGGLVLGLAAASRLAYAPLGLVVVLLGPGRARPPRDRGRRRRPALAVVTIARRPSRRYRFTGDLSFLTAERPTGQGVVGVRRAGRPEGRRPARPGRHA